MRKTGWCRHAENSVSGQTVKGCMQRGLWTGDRCAGEWKTDPVLEAKDGFLESCLFRIFVCGTPALRSCFPGFFLLDSGDEGCRREGELEKGIRTDIIEINRRPLSDLSLFLQTGKIISCRNANFHSPAGNSGAGKTGTSAINE